MHKNALFRLFLGLVCASALWFGVKSFFEIRAYWALVRVDKAHMLKVEVIEKSKERYLLRGWLALENGYRNILSQGTIGVYPNELAAQRRASAFTTTSTSHVGVWYDPRSPEEVFFRKVIPYKGVITAIVLFALCGYLTLLGYSIRD